MSRYIEWGRASSPAVFLDEDDAADIRDGHGSTVDRGNSALCVGESIVIEGTEQELREWLRDAMRQVGQ